MRKIDAVIAKNKEVGGKFFESRTVLYFSRKVLPTMYGDRYFISYDLTEDEGKRFTVREVLPSGLIKHVGEFHAYTSKSDAVDAIRLLMGETVTA
jgi:hypothetical protein